MSKFIILLDIVLVIVLAYFTWFMSTDYLTFQGRYHLPFVLWVIDTIDLFIHEGGHFFFGFMGRTIYFMGGSLMQIVIPSLAIWVFLRSGFRTLTGTLYWLGHNLVNISVYVADAPYRRLPLISDSATHDWSWILGRYGMLDDAASISGIILVAGVAACVGGVLTAVYFLVSDMRETFFKGAYD